MLEMFNFLCPLCAVRVFEYASYNFIYFWGAGSESGQQKQEQQQPAEAAKLGAAAYH